MLKRFWRWLWPDDDEPMEHLWTKWEMTGVVVSPQIFSPMKYHIQQRRCVDCGITEETSTYLSSVVGCGLVKQDEIDEIEREESVDME